MSGFICAYGDVEKIENNKLNYSCIIEVDLPYRMLIKDEEYTIMLFGEEYKFVHRIKQRGEESFSTINTTITPFFSSIRIYCKDFLEEIKLSNPKLKYEEEIKSYKIINEIINKIKRFKQNINIGKKFEMDKPILSYTVKYINKNTGDTDYLLLHPYFGKIKIDNIKEKIQIDDEAFKEYLIQEKQFGKYTEEEIKPNLVNKNFEEKVFILIHDFIYYCRQHSKALIEIKEEQIRDLFLIAVKIVLNQAEGEVFSFDGKLDFKITNPDNRYEYITGEFKWWNGGKSFEEAFHQGVRKHCTGQEKEIYIILLSRNKEIIKIKEKIIELTRSEKEIIIEEEKLEIAPKGSKEFIIQYSVETKGEKIPIKIGLANIFYENI